jgi:hypothetical protein
MGRLASGRDGRRAEERVNPAARLDEASKCSYTSNTQFFHARQLMTFYLSPSLSHIRCIPNVRRATGIRTVNVLTKPL